MFTASFERFRPNTRVSIVNRKLIRNISVFKHIVKNYVVKLKRVILSQLVFFVNRVVSIAIEEDTHSICSIRHFFSRLLNVYFESIFLSFESFWCEGRDVCLLFNTLLWLVICKFATLTSVDGLSAYCIHLACFGSLQVVQDYKGLLSFISFYQCQLRLYQHFHEQLLLWDCWCFASLPFYNLIARQLWSNWIYNFGSICSFPAMGFLSRMRHYSNFSNIYWVK